MNTSVGCGNIVLLAAGSGSRLRELTADTHKSLLPVAGKPAIERILEAVLTDGPAQVVVVLGHRAEQLRAFIEERFKGRVDFVVNDLYASDTNILSTDIGVDALRDPDAGYLIVETDLIIDDKAWRMVLSQETGSSFWVTKSRYGETLTGGALNAGEDGSVREIVYAPQYQPRYEGWRKLIGLLYVGAGQVQADREIRKLAIAQSIKQYYMTPWVANLNQLDCRALDLGEQFAVSYNDLAAYRSADAGSAQALSS